MKINECTSGLLKDASIQITQHFQASYAKTRQSSSCLKKEEAAKGQKKKKKKKRFPPEIRIEKEEIGKCLGCRGFFERQRQRRDVDKFN